MRIKQGHNRHKTFISSLLLFCLRLLVALIFITAGILKAYDPGHFLSQIMAFNILPYWAGYVTAHFVPMLEITCGVLLLTFSFSCAASLLLTILEIGFLFFLSCAQARGVDLNCGCFGNWLEIGNFRIHMALNLVIVAILVLHFIRNLRLQELMESKK